MSPWEAEALWADWLTDACAAEQTMQAALALNAQMLPLLREWRAHGAVHGEQASGWPGYVQLRDGVAALGQSVAGQVTLPNGTDLGRLLRVGLVPALCNTELAAPAAAGGQVPPPGLQGPIPGARPTTPPAQTVEATAMSSVPAAPAAGAVRATPAARLARPIIIVGAPRSGSTLLFETLAACLPVYTVRGESHRQIEQFAALRPQARGYASNRLERADASAAVADALRQAFLDSMCDRAGRSPADTDGGLRLLEKTPKNALRVPFLDAVFPDACFVYLLRDPRENVASLMDGWQSGRFVTYPDLPGWQGPPWSFLLIEGWRALIGSPVASIAAAQWQQAHGTLLDDLSVVPAERVHALDYGAFLQDPQGHVDAIARFAGLVPDRPVPKALPLARHTLTPPSPDKWRRHADAMAPHLPTLQSVAERARQFMQRCQAQRAAEAQR
jgi:hypothetical protein